MANLQLTIRQALLALRLASMAFHVLTLVLHRVLMVALSSFYFLYAVLYIPYRPKVVVLGVHDWALALPLLLFIVDLTHPGLHALEAATVVLIAQVELDSLLVVWEKFLTVRVELFSRDQGSVAVVVVMGAGAVSVAEYTLVIALLGG